jgi:hypothetical protein
MPNTKTVSKNILRNEWDLPGGGTEEIEVVSNELQHSNRWSNTFKLVIHDNRDDTYWSMLYDIGTGDKGERPWEYENEVELTRVYPKQIMITTYVDTPTEDMPEWKQGLYPE